MRKCEVCGLIYHYAEGTKSVRYYNSVEKMLCYECYHKLRVKMDGRVCDCFICKPTKRKK